MSGKRRSVRFIYRGSLENGEVFDECVDEPYEIEFGRGRVMAALEEELEAMKPGEERTITLPPSEAYGERLDDAIQSFPSYKVPNGENIPVGETIGWKTPRRLEPIPAKVVSVENQVVTLDFNHPLAGKTLTYWLKVVE